MANISVFEVQEVLQVTFIANDQKLAYILRDFSGNVNILAYSQILMKGGCTLVKFVPGQVVDGRYLQDGNDIVNTRSVLDKNHVSYGDDVVLHITPPDVAQIQALFSSVDLNIEAAYTGIANSIIYDVSDVELAKVVLQLPSAEQEELIKFTLKSDQKCRQIISKKHRPRCSKKDDSCSSSVHSSSSSSDCVQLKPKHRKNKKYCSCSSSSSLWQ
jgi:hypothetical protein